MAEPVFYDPQRARWKRLRRLVDAVVAALSALIIFFVYTTLRDERLPDGDRRFADAATRLRRIPHSVTGRSRLFDARLWLRHSCMERTARWPASRREAAPRALEPLRARGYEQPCPRSRPPRTKDRRNRTLSAIRGVNDGVGLLRVGDDIPRFQVEAQDAVGWLNRLTFDLGQRLGES